MKEEDSGRATPPIVVNLDEAPLDHNGEGQWACTGRALTPVLDALKNRAARARLGMNVTYLPAGHASCPFHSHALEDEVFYVLSGRGMLRYGDTVQALRAGDCISCPAGTGIAHQLANPFDTELVYLSVGLHEPNEICTYPDSGKVMVRSLQAVGVLRQTPYGEGEETPWRVFELLANSAAPKV